MVNKYNNACSEVYKILTDLTEEDYNRIPNDILNVIYENKNPDYFYELDYNLELKEQPMLPETKAILFNLFRDYLATKEQKEKIIKMQNEERQKNELKKQRQYNIDVFANKYNQNKTERIDEMQLVEYKENIFKKIINKIKRFFTKNT